MVTEVDQVFLGIDWAGEVPAVRLAEFGSPGPAKLVPFDQPMRFRVVEPSVRYCAGWFDLTGPAGRHVVCAGWRQVQTGRQCTQCRQREGFLAAHRGYEAPQSQMPDNLRDYLSQPHRLYVDIFADSSVKVGTVAQRRLHARLAEQGPVAACYVASAGNGLDVRRLEATVSRRLDLQQVVKVARKLRGLTSRVDTTALRQQLRKSAAEVCTLVAEMAGTGFPAAPIDPPQSWHPPAVTVAVFDATPLAVYPEPLSSGEHSLYLRGLAGSVGMVTVVPDVAADHYAASLDELYGVRLAFGDYHSRVRAVQPVLF